MKSLGSKYLMGATDCKNKKQLHNLSSLRCVRKRNRLTQNLGMCNIVVYNWLFTIIIDCIG